MQSEAIETVTEPLAQIDVCERQPYQAPSLVRLEFKNTEAGSAGLTEAGIFS
ncbi:hypothetical protein ACOAPY_06505 [Pseudomonas sp. P3C3]